MHKRRRKNFRSRFNSDSRLKNKQLQVSTSEVIKDHRYNRSKYASKPNVYFIKGIQFGIKSPEEILEQSVCEVFETTIYNRNIPRNNALNDHRMGTVDRRIECGTCGNPVERCAGHTGHIKLAIPLFNAMFFTVMLKILRSVCYFCSTLLLDPEVTDWTTLNQHPMNRIFYEVTRLAQKKKGSKRCWKCKGFVPDYKRKMLKIVRIWPSNVEFEDSVEEEYANRPMTAGIVREIFEHISDEDCVRLGINPKTSRPENLVTTVLLVPPICIRPAIMVSEGSRSKGQDDLTRKLHEILKQNKIIEKLIKEGKSPEDREMRKAMDDIQYHYATYLDNEISGIVSDKQRSGNPIRGIRKRLKGKEGRIRKNLSGKRVNFSARAPISADPCLDTDELGIPLKVAMTLTKPEIVTPQNINEMMQRVSNGPHVLFGAREVEYPNGRRVNLLTYHDRNKMDLSFGCTVHRFLYDGDYVLFNRHPSLHKQSLMGHRIRVMRDMNLDTFRLPLPPTKPYNADFDGDEMNVHVMQIHDAEQEVRQLMAVDKQVLDAQNRPSMGLVQDGLLAAYLFTRPNVFLNRGQVCMLMMQVHHDVPMKLFEIPPPAIVKPHAMWTGKQILSLLVPPITMMSNSPLPSDNDSVVIIRNGQLLTGSLTKKMMGPTSGGIIHCIALDYSGRVVCNFLADVQRMLNWWMMQRGFSIGMSDCLISQTNKDRIEQQIHEAFQTVNQIQNQVRLIPTLTIDEAEVPVFQVLGSVLNKTGEITQEYLNDSNSFYCMVASGSKGSSINISQVMACVGQQSVEGRRILNPHGTRTLCSFAHGDIHPKSRGFVESSYVQGLNPQEFFFHAMGGREGLVETAVRTAETGYLQRRMTKAMENLRIAKYGTVRDAQELVVSFDYGGDRMDASRLESRYVLKILHMDDEQLTQWVTGEKETAIRKREVDQLKQVRNEIRQAKITLLSPELNPEVYLPVDVERLLNSALAQHSPFEVQKGVDFEQSGEHYSTSLFDEPMKPQSPANETQSHAYEPLSPAYEPLSPAYEPLSPAYEPLSPAYEPLSPAYEPLSPGNEDIKYELSEEKIFDDVLQLLRNIEQLTPSLFLKGAILENLISRCVLDSQLTVSAWEDLLDTIHSKVRRALIMEGEMVGMLAAESVGELATQLTLNRFHLSGVASKNVSAGVPRLKELLEVSKNMRIPSLTIYLKRPFQFKSDGDAVFQFCSSLIQTYLEDVVSETDVISVNEFQKTDVFETAQLFMEESYFTTHSHYLIKMKLKPITLVSRTYNCGHVIRAIQDHIGGKGAVWGTPENVRDWYVYIHLGQPLLDMMDKLGSTVTNVRETERVVVTSVQTTILKHVIIGGIQNIQNATVRQIRSSQIDPQTQQISIQPERVIDTEGTALSMIWALSMVDWSRTYSNDLQEIQQALGLEAAVHLLYSEICQVLDSSYVNVRHLETIVNTMSYRGYLMPLNRFGINRVDTSPLAKSSFEESMDILLHAAVFGEKDPIQNVSARIMTGRRPDIGRFTHHRRQFHKRMSIQQRIDQTKEGDQVEEKNVVSNSHYYQTFLSSIKMPWEKKDETPTQKCVMLDQIEIHSPPPSPSSSSDMNPPRIVTPHQFTGTSVPLSQNLCPDTTQTYYPPSPVLQPRTLICQNLFQTHVATHRCYYPPSPNLNASRETRQQIRDMTQLLEQLGDLGGEQMPIMSGEEQTRTQEHAFRKLRDTLDISHL